MKQWYTIQAKAEQADQAHIIIDGEIGESWWSDDGIASRQFMNSIKAMGPLSLIEIDMNSPGGSVSDGVTIANYLRQHDARVVVNVLGQASSIASVIASAADEVNMGLGSWGLLHDPWTFAIGNADQLRAMADDLDTLQAGIMAHYIARCGEDKAEQLNLLIKGETGEGTLMSAQDWVDIGLADQVMVEVKAAASMNGLTQALVQARAQASSRLLKPPQSSSSQNTPDQSDKTGTGPALTSTDLAQAISTERNRVSSIIQACNSTGQPQLIEKLVANGMNAQQAGEYILDVAHASGNKQHIFNSHTPDGKSRTQTLNHADIYNRYNRTHTGDQS